MLIALTLLLVFQLAGEAISRIAGIAVPGPVIGFALLAGLLMLSPRLMRVVEPTANTLVRHLSLLFVPAAVGIIQQAPRLMSEGVAIVAALLVSTVAALAVTALTFRAVSRRMGLGGE